MEKFSFLITLTVVFNVLGYVKSLTVLLQQRSLDIVQGIELVEDVQEQVRELREEVDKWHKVWFEMAVDVAEAVNTEEPSIPRRCGRQTQRSNVPADVPEVYYRRTLTVPFLDHLISELSDRFSANAKVGTLGFCLVPAVLVKKRKDWLDRVKALASLYEADLPCPLSLQINRASLLGTQI